MLQGYDSLLSIDDVEKKALAQPPENRWLTSRDVVVVKKAGKAEQFYSASHGLQTTLKHSGMDHTV